MENTPNKTVNGPKALFWYLSLFFTLGLTAFNTGGLLFQHINKWIPMEVVGGMVRSSFDQVALKFNIATVIVATPLFFLFSYIIRKALKNNSLNPKNKIRVWITYIILFLTIAITAGDLIITIFRVLDGDYTARFLLKALSILIIVGWIFAYYWLELKDESSLVKSKLPKVMAGIAISVITIAFIGAFFIVDSPIMARAKAFDRTKVEDLQEIKYGIDDYFREYSELPKSLNELKTYRAYIDIINPQSKEKYEYQIKDKISYEICTEFTTSNKEDESFNKYGYREFLHDAGRNCFLRKIDKLNPGVSERMPEKIDY